MTQREDGPTSDGDPWSLLGERPGLCIACTHARANATRRGTAYLRCGRASWDDRLPRYPRLPVLACPGFEPLA